MAAKYTSKVGGSLWKRYLLVNPSTMASVFASCARSSHLHVNVPLFRVVWMCLGIVLIAVLKVLQGPVLSSQQWGDELLLLSDFFSSPQRRQEQSRFVLESPAWIVTRTHCVWMAKRGRGWSCSFLPRGVLSLARSSWLQRSSRELLSRARGPAVPRRKDDLALCRSDAVMALVLRWFHQWSLGARRFHCLLCLSSWNLWEKHWFGEVFRIIVPSLFYHLHVCAAVTLIWCATWIT